MDPGTKASKTITVKPGENIEMPGERMPRKKYKNGSKRSKKVKSKTYTK